MTLPPTELSACCWAVERPMSVPVSAHFQATSTVEPFVVTCATFGLIMSYVISLISRSPSDVSPRKRLAGASDAHFRIRSGNTQCVGAMYLRYFEHSQLSFHSFQASRTGAPMRGHEPGWCACWTSRWKQAPEPAALSSTQRHGTALAVFAVVKKLAHASAWLQCIAAAFALVFAVVILGDAAATIVLNGLAQELPQSPTVMRYATVH